MVRMQRFAVFVFVAIVFAVVGAPSGALAQSAPGLVAAYGFNEGTGAQVGDLSGNSLTGTINGATWTASGKYGSALSFDGSTSFVDLGNPAALKLTASMTVEAWVKAAANPADDGIIVAKADGSGGWQLKTSPDTGPHTFCGKVWATGPGALRFSNTVRALNTWYHVASVYDAAAQTIKVYVNGTLDNGTLNGTIPSAQVDRPINANIGRRTGGFYFSGVIDEVRVYNRALSPGEIQTDMTTPVGGTPPPPDTTPPMVSVTAPAAGATITTATSVTATASDNVGVASVQLQVDGAPLGGLLTVPPYTTTWNAPASGAGPHTLTAVARDAAGNATLSASVAVTVSAPAASQVGQWSAVAGWPIVAVHASLLPTGNVLAWTDYTTNQGAQIWRPDTNTFTPKSYSTTSLFCAGHSFLPDGRLFVVGGIVGLVDDLGPRETTIFDPATETWSQGGSMNTGRYYPTATTLGDGRVLALGGTTTCVSCIADLPEIYDPTTNVWTNLASSARLSLRYYPHPFVLPDGRVIVVGEDDHAVATRVLDLNSQSWTTVDPGVFDGHSSAMYLPGKFMKAGTATADNPGFPAAPTTYVLDMTQPSPAWQSTAPMAFARSYVNLTILPDGQVLATGGGTVTDKADFSHAVYEAELWSPSSKSWTTMARSQTPRLYHSTALLLPDARVLVAGGGREAGRSQPDPKDQQNAEIYSPPYLFKGPRPTITSAPSVLAYNGTFSVATPDGARIASVSLVALSAVTHSFNESQRFVPLSFTAAGGSLNVAAPVNGNLAPPGPYMLFIVDNTGVPSVAAMVRLPPAAVVGDTTPPTVSLTSPTAGATVNGTVTISASASDNVGVTGVQFLLDGAALGAQVTGAGPYSLSWASTSTGNGPHTLSARARDAAGNTTLAAGVGVTVSNTGPPAGLVAAYGFSEASGATVGDSSGHGLAGTINGATWVTGKYGPGLSFNGTTAFVDLGNPAAMQLTGSMTVEAWVKAAANPGDDGIIVAKADGSGGWQLKTSPDTGPHTFGGKAWQSASASAQRYSTTVRALNTWYHVATVYDAAARTLSIYVNGALDNGTLKGTIPTSLVDRGVNANIGRRTGGYYFNGVIDEVRVYNRALSQAEVQTDMNTPLP